MLSVCLQANLPFAHDPPSHPLSHSSSRSLSQSHSHSHSDSSASVSALPAGHEVVLCDGDTWRLDVRRLSTGGAVVVLRQWLAKLVHVITATAVADVEEGGGTSGGWRSSGRLCHCEGEPCSLESSSAEISTLSPHSLNPNSCSALPEVILQLMPVQVGRRQSVAGEEEILSHTLLRQSPSGRQLLVVTGWGRKARWGQGQGESKVKLAVAAELQRLGLPFRQVKQGRVSGRWELGEAELRLWLQSSGRERVVELLQLTDGRWEEQEHV